MLRVKGLGDYGSASQRGEGHSLRAHKGILKKEVIVNLIKGDFRFRLVFEHSQHRGEMKHPQPDQRSKVGSMALPGRETQRKPEAGQAAGKGSEVGTFQMSTADGNAHFRTSRRH